ncbi:MAG: S-methyl-5'-thioadenosine phosphorylase [Nitrospirota bacterium]|jgi:5'-methylthioadenosine phosphorylase
MGSWFPADVRRRVSMVYYITMQSVGVIGGSGLYDIEGLKILEQRELETPYGRPSAPFALGELDGVRLVFLPRHGLRHEIAPHRVNYRANIRGFRDLGAERIISVNATGGINPSLAPGDLVVLDQVLDMTQGARPGTFYEEGEVVHVDFTEPYCPELRASALLAGKEAGLALRAEGTYLCVNGPRLESRAEVRFFARGGADLVGMTAMPEAVLARELEMCLLGISVVTNRAAGLTGQKLTTEEVVQMMKESTRRLRLLIKETVARIPPRRHCPCKDALTGARM